MPTTRSTLRQVAQHLMREPDRTEAIGPVVADGLPTTVMWGEHDDVWPVAMQLDMARRLGAAAVELPGLGHSPNAQDAGALVRALLAAWGSAEAALLGGRTARWASAPASAWTMGRAWAR